MVADYARQSQRLDEVLMSVSPLNPLKRGSTDLASDHDRMEMLRTACSGMTGITPCDMELAMPRPSYTIDTLNALQHMYPDADISIIIGSDNWQLFDHWRAHDEIIERFGIIIYPRPGYGIDNVGFKRNIVAVDAPTVDLSSTFLREKLAEGYDMNIFMPHGVYNYIKTHKLYGT